jgi:hypothetical protein
LNFIRYLAAPEYFLNRFGFGGTTAPSVPSPSSESELEFSELLEPSTHRYKLASMLDILAIAIDSNSQLKKVANVRSEFS